MTISPSKVRRTWDYASAVTLRNLSDGAEVATATEAAISLSELDTAYWHGNEIPHGKMVIGVHVTALNLSTNTYTFAVLVDDVAAMNDTPVVVYQQVLTAPGYYEFVVDSADIPNYDTDSSGTDKWMAMRCTIAGTPDSPSVTYGAAILKSLGAGR